MIKINNMENINTKVNTLLSRQYDIIHRVIIDGISNQKNHEKNKIILTLFNITNEFITYLNLIDIKNTNSTNNLALSSRNELYQNINHMKKLICAFKSDKLTLDILLNNIDVIISKMMNLSTILMCCN